MKIKSISNLSAALSIALFGELSITIIVTIKAGFLLRKNLAAFLVIFSVPLKALRSTSAYYLRGTPICL